MTARPAPVLRSSGRRLLTFLLAASLVPAGGAVLAGCGSDEETAPPTSPPGASAPAATLPPLPASIEVSGGKIDKDVVGTSVGKAAAAFDQYIAKPSGKGDLTMGAKGRKRAAAKAALAGAYASALLKKAAVEVDKDPQFLAYSRRLYTAMASARAIGQLFQDGEPDPSAVPFAVKAIDGVVKVTTDLGIAVDSEQSIRSSELSS